jgi:RNA polymerase-binding transcription factor DksA
MPTCYICDEEISEETLHKYPDTELCGECIIESAVKDMEEEQ